MIAMGHHAPDYKAEVFKVIGKGITIYVVMYCAYCADTVNIKIVNDTVNSIHMRTSVRCAQISQKNKFYHNKESCW